MPFRIVLSFGGQIVSEFELQKPLTVVGRHSASDIVVDDGAVSVRHLLFRRIGQTCYVEDLDSSNGTVVNGVDVSTQVVHHLDVIEIGRHRIHFFDDTLLRGVITDTDETVLTDFEPTRFVDPAEARNPELDPIPRRATARLALRTRNGGTPGSLVELTRSNTVLGNFNEGAAVVMRSRHGFHVTKFGGGESPRLNGVGLLAGSHTVAVGDVIDVGDSTFEVIGSLSDEDKPR